VHDVLAALNVLQPEQEDADTEAGHEVLEIETSHAAGLLTEQAVPQDSHNLCWERMNRMGMTGESNPQHQIKKEDIGYNHGAPLSPALTEASLSSKTANRIVHKKSCPLNSPSQPRSIRLEARPSVEEQKPVSSKEYNPAYSPDLQFSDNHACPSLHTNQELGSFDLSTSLEPDRTYYNTVNVDYAIPNQAQPQSLASANTSWWMTEQDVGFQMAGLKNENTGSLSDLLHREICSNDFLMDIYEHDLGFMHEAGFSNMI